MPFCVYIQPVHSFDCLVSPVSMVDFDFVSFLVLCVLSLVAPRAPVVVFLAIFAMVKFDSVLALESNLSSLPSSTGQSLTLGWLEMRL